MRIDLKGTVAAVFCAGAALMMVYYISKQPPNESDDRIARLARGVLGERAKDVSGSSTPLSSIQVSSSLRTIENGSTICIGMSLSEDNSPITHTSQIEQKSSFQADLEGFFARNLTEILPEQCTSFVIENQKKYSLLMPEEMMRMVAEHLSGRRDEVKTLVRSLSDHDETNALVERKKAEIYSSIAAAIGRVNALRGSGFDGDIHKAWQKWSKIVYEKSCVIEEMRKRVSRADSLTEQGLRDALASTDPLAAEYDRLNENLREAEEAKEQLWWEYASLGGGNFSPEYRGEHGYSVETDTHIDILQKQLLEVRGKTTTERKAQAAFWNKFL